jgi:type IV pilus assembly protein PilO
MLQRLGSLLERLKWSHVVILVGGSAAFFYFMQDTSEIEAKEAGIQGEEQQISTLERKIQEAKEFERQFDDKKKRYAELVKSLQNLKEALPRQFFLPDLLSDLLREAKQLELEITLVRPDLKEEQGELYNSLGFNIEARGSFIQFFIFLDRMAHMARLINVESFSIIRDPKRSYLALANDDGPFAGTKMTGGRITFPAITGSIKVQTYRYRGAPSSGAPAAAPSGGKK